MPLRPGPVKLAANMRKTVGKTVLTLRVHDVFFWIDFFWWEPSFVDDCCIGVVYNLLLVVQAVYPLKMTMLLFGSGSTKLRCWKLSAPII